MERRLIDPAYLAFPFRLTASGGAVSRRMQHIKSQIEQVLFTDPGERVFNLDFGVGVKRLMFEPNNTSLWDIARQQLFSNLSEALRGEVDPASLEINFTAAPDQGLLKINVSYRLATINSQEQHEFNLYPEQN